MSEEETYVVIIRSIVTFVAVFFGAWFAYRLQNLREIKNEEKKKKAALNIALFTLLRQYNALAVFKKDLDALKNDKSRAFKLRPWKTNEYNDLKFDIESLNFIIETDNPNILFRLLIEQERFEQALESIKVRSKYQVNVIQPLLEKSEIGNKIVPDHVVEKTIGKYKLEGLVLGTNEVYSQVYESFESTENMLSEMHSFAKHQYPNNKFIKCDENT